MIKEDGVWPITNPCNLMMVVYLVAMQTLRAVVFGRINTVFSFIKDSLFLRATLRKRSRVTPNNNHATK